MGQIGCQSWIHGNSKRCNLLKESLESTSFLQAPIHTLSSVSSSLFQTLWNSNNAHFIIPYYIWLNVKGVIPHWGRNWNLSCFFSLFFFCWTLPLNWDKEITYNIQNIAHFTCVRLFTEAGIIQIDIRRDSRRERRFTLCYMDSSDVFVFTISSTVSSKITPSLKLCFLIWTPCCFLQQLSQSILYPHRNYYHDWCQCFSSFNQTDIRH